MESARAHGLSDGTLDSLGTANAVTLPPEGLAERMDVRVVEAHPVVRERDSLLLQLDEAEGLVREVDPVSYTHLRAHET